MQQFKADIERMITKVNAKESLMEGSTLKDILVLLSSLIDAIVLALPDSAGPTVKNLLGMISSLLRSIIKML